MVEQRTHNTCLRCGWSWYSLTHKNANPEDPPRKAKICPKCKSAYWERPRERHLDRPPAKWNGDPKDDPSKKGAVDEFDKLLTEMEKEVKKPVKYEHVPSVDEELYS